MSAPLPPQPARTPDGAPDPGRARVGRLLLWQSAALLAMIGAFSLHLPFKLLVIALALVALVLGARIWAASRRVERSGAGRAAASAGAVTGSSTTMSTASSAERSWLRDMPSGDGSAIVDTACTDVSVPAGSGA